MDWLRSIVQKNKSRIGLQLDGEYVDYCLLDIQSQNKVLTTCGSVQFPTRDAIPSILNDLMSSLNAKGAEAFWVIPTSQYRLMTVPKPKVPEAEILEAVKWQIKDQIDFKVEDAVVQCFDLPDKVPGETRVYVVIVHRSVIEELVSISEKINSEIKVININELALGNLLEHYFKEGQNLGFISETRHGININCYLGNEFAFTRHLNGVYLPQEEDDDVLSLDAVEEIDDDENGRLLLEVQRTLDYYESQVARKPITKLVIPELGNKTLAVQNLFNENLGAQVEVLKLNELMTINDGLKSSSVNGCLQLCGGLLREVDAAHAKH